MTINSKFQHQDVKHHLYIFKTSINTLSTTQKVLDLKKTIKQQFLLHFPFQNQSRKKEKQKLRQLTNFSCRFPFSLLRFASRFPEQKLLSSSFFFFSSFSFFLLLSMPLSSSSFSSSYTNLTTLSFTPLILLISFLAS